MTRDTTISVIGSGGFLGFAIKRVLKILVSESDLSIISNSLSNLRQESLISANLKLPLSAGLSARLIFRLHERVG